MLDLCSKDRCSHEELLILVLDSSGESSSNKRNHSTNFHILSQKTTKLPEVILIQQPNLFLNHVSSGWMEDCENASQLAYENRQSTNQWKVLRLSGRPSIQTRIWRRNTLKLGLWDKRVDYQISQISLLCFWLQFPIYEYSETPSPHPLPQEQVRVHSSSMAATSVDNQSVKTPFTQWFQAFVVEEPSQLSA